MHTYIFKGLILPERAQISFGPLNAELHHLSSERDLRGKMNVVLNQVTVWMYSDDEWDIFDLRNIVKSWVNDVSAVFGFVIGHAYEVEIRQVLCESLNIDYVFGIDIPCIKERSKDIDIDKKISDLIKKSGGECGLYIRRCLNDLNMALKHPDDTAFYCFRGLEALKQCCRYVFEINEEKKQWERLSEITGFGRDDIEFIRTGAFPARHGDISLIDAEGRVKMLERTWDIVEAFIEKA